MRIKLIAVPYDSGRRGERMGAGPEALAGRVTDALTDAGVDVDYVRVEPASTVWPSEIRLAFALAGLVAGEVKAARAAGRLPVVLSGNCGPAALGACSALGRDRCVVWLDAHGDFNTPDTTIGGFLDGMALATLCGRCWPELTRTIPGFRPVDEHSVWLLGARDLDPLEATLLDTSRVKRLAASAIDARGAQTVLADRGDGELYLHVDLDVLDLSEGRVNAYSVEGGVSAAALTQFASAMGPDVSAVTFSAYDPACDADGRIAGIAVNVITALTTSME